MRDAFVLQIRRQVLALDGIDRAIDLFICTLFLVCRLFSLCCRLHCLARWDGSLFVHVSCRSFGTKRLLIPLSAGGLVIGRKGANIAALLKASGAKVSLGQKSEVKANERIVTVTGTLSSATKVMISFFLSGVVRCLCKVKS